jgi:hypothetical protein
VCCFVLVESITIDCFFHKFTYHLHLFIFWHTQAIVFAGFLAGFIFYLCIGNYQRAKRAMDRQRKRRIELEEDKRALAFNGDSSPRSITGSNVGNGSRRRIDNKNNNMTGGKGVSDSPKSGYSGTSSMYTDEKGLTAGVGGVTVDNGSSHLLLGAENLRGGIEGRGGSQFSSSSHQHNQYLKPPRDLLDDEMSV